ncbi:MAG: FtsX-like permease family protein [Candidatus Lokiarchaeota archaeon]|nr:FtsX-like permease family protein [Candidatus Lokiarchaeota archaeon]
MNIRDFWYRLQLKINLQFIKNSWIDLKRSKAKAFFGIGGIAISIILLTAIGMVNDTMSYNYIDSVTNTTGSADIMITKIPQTDITYDPYFEESLIQNELYDISGVDEFFPRIMSIVKTFSTNSNSNGSLQLYGIDFIQEATNGKMGDLKIVDDNGIETGEIYNEEPDDGECVILWNVAELLNVSIGDFIHLEYQQYTLDLEVIMVCEQDLKFFQFETSLILVNLDQAQDFFQRSDQINFLVGTIENPQFIYDVSNLEETTARLREIGTRIQQRLEISTYSVTMPKLEELSSGEFTLMMMTIIFWFITILSILITGILINSILSTSIEERMREFGIMRVVGGKKGVPIKMVLFEGLLLGVFGSIIGVIIGVIFTPSIVSLLFSMTDFPFVMEEFVINPETIILELSIGSITSLSIALIPALKASSQDLIKSITPFHTKEEGWEVKKEGSINIKNFLIGISISTLGMIVFILLPRIMVTGGIMMIAGLFIGMLAAILLGLVFASVGIIPIIQRVFLSIISPFIRKYRNIIKISLKRYTRRNTSTIVMFSISFSFIFFITSVTEMQSATMSTSLKLQYGSDLVLANQGYDSDSALTLEMVEELKSFPGIKSLAISLFNTYDLTAIISTIFSSTEGGIGFGDDSSEQAFVNIFEFYARQAESKFQVTAADISNFNEIEAGFIGIDEDFTNLVEKELIIWSSPNSGFNYSFSQMLQNNNTCIIAKSIASVLGIDDVGEYIRLNFYNPKIQNDPGNISLFKVVGICGGMPGYWNFRSSEGSAFGGGILVSVDNYMNLMKVDNPGEPNMIVDKIFINLIENSEENIKSTMDDISTTYKDRSFSIDDAISKVNFMVGMMERQSSLMEIILLFAVVISIFGLISNMFAIMLERKFEIGILRSMGMKTRNVRNMFLIESLLLLLSAGTMGTFIGTYCGYLLETNMALMTELPANFILPIDSIFRVFTISIAIGVIGMYFILIRLSRQSIMDIFRQTF